MTNLARIVRGEVDPRSVSGPSPDLQVDSTITIEDVALGLVQASTATERQQPWGQFILQELNVDLESCEAHPHWDMILNAIWDMAFGSPPSDDAIGAAREILQNQRRDAPG